jgi:hypothetical protein
VTELRYEGLRRRIAALEAERDRALTRARQLQTAGDHLAAAGNVFVGERSATWSVHHLQLWAAIQAWRAQ